MDLLYHKTMSGFHWLMFRKCLFIITFTFSSVGFCFPLINSGGPTRLVYLIPNH